MRESSETLEPLNTEIIDIIPRRGNLMEALMGLLEEIFSDEEYEDSG